jgi:hypothetical protein
VKAPPARNVLALTITPAMASSAHAGVCDAMKRRRRRRRHPHVARLQPDRRARRRRQRRDVLHAHCRDWRHGRRGSAARRARGQRRLDADAPARGRQPGGRHRRPERVSRRRPVRASDRSAWCASTCRRRRRERRALRSRRGRSRTGFAAGGIEPIDPCGITRGRPSHDERRLRRAAHPVESRRRAWRRSVRAGGRRRSVRRARPRSVGRSPTPRRRHDHDHAHPL